MINNVHGGASLTTSFTTHVVDPEGMNPAELSAAINRGDVQAQEFAIRNILKNNGDMHEDVLSALESCLPCLNADAQRALMHRQLVGNLQKLQENPRFSFVLNRFFEEFSCAEKLRISVSTAQIANLKAAIEAKFYQDGEFKSSIKLNRGSDGSIESADEGKFYMGSLKKGTRIFLDSKGGITSVCKGNFRMNF